MTHPPTPPPVAEHLASFDAWLATRVDDGPTRRRYRRIVADYLGFAARDEGPPGTRRVRFLVALDGGADPDTVAAALTRLTEYDEHIARTPS